MLVGFKFYGGGKTRASSFPLSRQVVVKWRSEGKKLLINCMPSSPWSSLTRETLHLLLHPPSGEWRRKI